MCSVGASVPVGFEGELIQVTLRIRREETDCSAMTWGLLTNLWEGNRVNDQHHRTEQNKFQRLNIYMFKKKKEVIKTVDKIIGNCFYNLGGEEGFSKHNIGEEKIRRLMDFT